MKLTIVFIALLIYVWLSTFRFRVSLAVYVGFLATALHSVAVIPGQSVVKLAFPALILGYVAHGVSGSRRTWFDKELGLWTGAFFATALLGLILSGGLGGSGAKAWQLAGPMALGLIVSVGAREERTLRTISWGFVGFSSLSAVIAIAQASDLAFLAPVASLTTATDVLDPNRVPGPFNNPNGLAAVLSVSMPLAFVLFALEARAVRRVVLALALAVLGVALIFTYSRSGWFGATAGILLLLSSKRIRRRVAVPVALVVGTGVVSYLLLGRDESIAHARIAELALNTISGVNSVAERLAAWQKALAIARDHTLLGIGYGNFPSAQIAGRFRWVTGRVTHNVFMTVLAEMGVVGLGLLVALFVRVFRNLWAGVRCARSTSLSALSWGFLAAMLSYVVGQGMAHGSLGSEVMWVLIGLSFAVRSLGADAASSEDRIAREACRENGRS
ncbi:MAG: O-antigen ligase family protein [Candidatus Eisenbacteria bacterium]